MTVRRIMTMLQAMRNENRMRKRRTTASPLTGTLIVAVALLSFVPTAFGGTSDPLPLDDYAFHGAAYDDNNTPTDAADDRIVVVGRAVAFTNIPFPRTTSHLLLAAYKYDTISLKWKPDTTFGTNGYKLDSIYGSLPEHGFTYAWTWMGQSVAVQDTSAGRKYIISGFLVSYQGTPLLMVGRYAQNGTREWLRTYPISYPGMDPAGTVVASQGEKIIVSTDYLGNYRFTSGGSLDSSFGSSQGHVAVQGDGKVITAKTATAGAGQPVYLKVTRYNIDGNVVDNTFGTAGSTSFLICNNTDQCSALLDDVKIDSGGRIVVVGSLNGDFAAWRLNATGGMDGSFDSDGQVTRDLFATDHAVSVVTRSSGEVALGGYKAYPGSPNSADGAVAMFSSGGAPGSWYSFAYPAGKDDRMYGIVEAKAGPYPVVLAGHRTESNGKSKGVLWWP